MRCSSGSAPTSTRDSPALVLHFARAGDAPRTWDYAQRAGRLARASYANADAADHLETALDVSRRVPGVTDAERARLWAAVGDLRELAGMFAESVEAYRARGPADRGPTRSPPPTCCPGRPPPTCAPGRSARRCASSPGRAA